MCQITSKPYGDNQAVVIEEDSFETGSLQLISYIRPGKLFTANSSIIQSQVGKLKEEPFQNIIEAVVKILRSGISSKTTEETNQESVDE